MSSKTIPSVSVANYDESALLGFGLCERNVGGYKINLGASINDVLGIIILLKCFITSVNVTHPTICPLSGYKTLPQVSYFEKFSEIDTGKTPL